MTEEARPMSASRIHRDGRAIALFATLTMALAGCHAGATAPSTADDPTLHGVEAAPSALHRPDLAVAIGDAAVARERGDWQNLRRFQAALVDRVGAAAVSDARADFQRALADLDAAGARGDGRVRAAIRVQLRTMCAAGSVVSAFETCAADVVTWGP